MYAYTADVTYYQSQVQPEHFSLISAMCVFVSILSFKSAALIIITTTGLQYKVGLGCMAAPFVKPAALMAIGHLTKA